MSAPEPPEVGRWVGMGEAMKRLLLVTIAAAVGVGGTAGLVGWATGHSVSGTMAAAYYLIGSALFLVGMFPTGGFSMIRGTITRRRPIGARQEPVFLLGLVLVGVGVVVDLTRPF